MPPVGMQKSCYWCESTEHDRRGCPLFSDALRSGKVKFNDVYHIIFVATGEEIPLNRDRGGQKELFEKLMLQISKPPARSSANVIVAEPALGNLGPENAVVLATLHDDGSIKEEVYDVDVYEKRKRGEFSQAGRRNRPCQGEDVTPSGQHQRGSQPSGTRESQTPMFMEDDPPEPKQKYQLLSKLSEVKSIEDIGSKILETPVTIPLSELLSVSSDLSTFIHDQTRKRRVPVETPKAQTTTAAPNSIPTQRVNNSATVNNISSGESLYACPSRRVKATIDGTTQMEVLLDNGSEVNLMPKRTFDKLNFPIDKILNGTSTASGTMKRWRKARVWESAMTCPSTSAELLLELTSS